MIPASPAGIRVVAGPCACARLARCHTRTVGVVGGFRGRLCRIPCGGRVARCLQPDWPEPDMRLVTNRETPVAVGGFAGMLVETGLVTRNDLIVAEQHARRERLELVDALVALNLTPEEEAYRVLGQSLGLDLMPLDAQVASELAVRLVPERSRAASGRAAAGRQPHADLRHLPAVRPRSRARSRVRVRPADRRRSLATRSAVLDALERCYPKLRELDVLAARLSDRAAGRRERRCRRRP